VSPTADSDRGFQSSPPPAPSGVGGSASANVAAATAPPAETQTVSPAGDAPQGGDVAASPVVLPGNDDMTLTPVVETADLTTWPGTVGTNRRPFGDRLLTACGPDHFAQACSPLQARIGQWLSGPAAVRREARSAGADRSGGRPPQGPRAPRAPGPDQPPLPTAPSSSAGSGATAGSHGGGLLGLMGAAVGLLALAANRAVRLLERRPPRPQLVSLLERPG
jgi:hypothetical protein